MTELGTRKGFYFQRLEGGRVRLRVKVGEHQPPVELLRDHAPVTPDPVPRFREVELTAAEWCDVIASVAWRQPQEPGADLRPNYSLAVDLHMGEAGDGL